MKSSKIKAKVVWITGASSGIGSELVKQLAPDNQIILSSRSEGKLIQLASDLKLKEKDFYVLPMDVSQYHNLNSHYQKALEHFGRIDILINNAGISQRSKAIETDIKVDQAIFNVNFFGSVALTKLVLPKMIERRAGQIVVISSVVGKFGSPLRTAYSASKHALHGFYDSLRAELFDDNIAVILICPGFIQTDISKNALTGDGSKHNKLDDAQQSGISAEKCAEQIIHAVANKKSEVVIARKEKWGVLIKRFFPKLFEFMIRKVKVT